MAKLKEESLKHSRLLELLTYDPEDGRFSYLVKRPGRQANRKMAGTIRPDGRCQVMIDRKVYLASRLAWFYMTRKWPEHEIDHINRNAADERWCNLREATPSQNTMNRFIPNKYGFKGVTFDDRCNRFSARIKVKGKTYYLGYFKTAEEAGAAYARVIKRYHGEFARLNG